MTLKAPPRGRLFQEDLCRPRLRFWMLVACVLVNRCTWEVAGPVHSALRRAHSIRSLAAADEAALALLLRRLGFQNQRARKLRALAAEWLRRPPRTATDVLLLPGCGRYAADSWAIFVDGDLSVEPSDGKLSWHLARLRATARPPRGSIDSVSRNHRTREESRDVGGEERRARDHVRGGPREGARR